jgi:hypothetical protein
MIQFQINDDSIFIFGFPHENEEEIYITNDGSIDVREPEFFFSKTIDIPEIELLEKVNISGIGENLSGFIIELTTYPWADRSQIDQIIALMKEYYPDSLINWEDTLKYLEGYN